MEHKIYKIIRKYKIPLFFRIFIMLIFVLLGIISILLPIPTSAPFWIFLIMIGSIFVIWVRDLKPIKKIRKGIIFFIKNIIDSRIREHKIKDIKKHIKHILKNKKK
jgi:hypothetical protein